MKDKSKNILKIAFVFVGNIIGAGFATGSELSGFFLRYGKSSIFGLVLSCILFGLICYMVLSKIAVQKPCNFTEYFSDLPQTLVRLMNFIVSAFLWASLCVMYSAGGAVFSYAFSLPKIYGSIVVSVICMLIILGGARGFVRANGILTAVMIFGLLFVGINALLPVFAYNDILKITAPFIYTSYNTITAVAVLTAVSKYVSDRDMAKKSAALAGLVLGVISVVLWLALYIFGDLYAEIPMLSVVSENYAVIYCVVLFMAILTTAVGNGMAALNGLGFKKPVRVLLLLIPVLLAGSKELNTLVVKVYSFFGTVGLVVMGVVLIDGFKFLRKYAKNRVKQR